MAAGIRAGCQVRATHPAQRVLSFARGQHLRFTVQGVQYQFGLLPPKIHPQGFEGNYR